MYENEIYSGAGAGSNTSGAESTNNATDSTNSINNATDSTNNAMDSTNNAMDNTNSTNNAMDSTNNAMYGTDSTNNTMDSTNSTNNTVDSTNNMINTINTPSDNTRDSSLNQGVNTSAVYGTGINDGFGHAGGESSFAPGMDSSRNTAGFMDTERENGSRYSTYQTGPGSNPTGTGGKKKKPDKVKKAGGGYFRKAMMSISLGLFFGLFAGAGFYAVNLASGAGNNNNDNMISDQNQTGASLTNTSSDESQSGIKLTDTGNVRVVSSDVSDVVDEVMPAMVSIINNFTQQSNIFGQNYTQEAAASGTGIIVAESDTELLIVSNYHVIADATKLDISFIDGTTAEASVKGTDADMDLAVIAIPLEMLSEETKNAIAIATLGDSDALNMGEPVIAIGNALGYGQSVTNGIVSALDRQITIDDGSTGSFIQTNAAINPGNSGGALLNVNGEVIGINSNKIGGTAIEGMGYAIPISAAKPIIADLMLKQTRTKVEESQAGYLGISLQPITDELITMYRIPQGIYVVGVEEGSPAQESGMLSGDIITAFEGEKITSYEDLQNILQYYGSGTSVIVTVMRPQNGTYESVELNITLGNKPLTETQR